MFAAVRATVMKEATARSADCWGQFVLLCGGSQRLLPVEPSRATWAPSCSRNYCHRATHRSSECPATRADRPLCPGRPPSASATPDRDRCPRSCARLLPLLAIEFDLFHLGPGVDLRVVDVPAASRRFRVHLSIGPVICGEPRRAQPHVEKSGSLRPTHCELKAVQSAEPSVIVMPTSPDCRTSNCHQRSAATEMRTLMTSFSARSSCDERGTERVARVSADVGRTKAVARLIRAVHGMRSKSLISAGTSAC